MSTTIRTLNFSLPNQIVKKVLVVVKKKAKTFDSDENIEVDDGDDVTRTDSNDMRQLASEVLFLIKRRSRFGRTIRFNGRFIL